MSKHSRGPWWKCGGATPHYVAISSPNGYIIFSMADPTYDSENGQPVIAPPIDEQNANAHLIAAAPTMYAALETVLTWFTNVNAVTAVEMVNGVMAALKEAGMEQKVLDSAAVAILKGAAHA